MAITKKTLMGELKLMVRDDEISQKTIIRLSEENKILKDTIGKAIEYIKSNTDYYSEMCLTGLSGNECEKLLNILKGDSDE